MCLKYFYIFGLDYMFKAFLHLWFGLYVQGIFTSLIWIICLRHFNLKIFYLSFKLKLQKVEILKLIVNYIIRYFMCIISLSIILNDNFE